MILYHGTSKEKAASIMRSQFDFDARRSSDPGDFGWGVYLTAYKPRAKAYGEVVLEVVIDDSRLAYIPNPYFLEKLEEIKPVTPEEIKFYDLAFDDNLEMLTIHAVNREDVCKKIQKEFVLDGYTGIRSDYHGGEYVIFDSRAVKSIIWRTI